MMLEVRSLNKSFGIPPTQVLFDLSFKIPTSEFVSIAGRSGSGKSTLLYIISTLDRPTTGSILIENTDVTLLSQHDLHHFRNTAVGFIFQFHYLLPELTALENVLMPARRIKQHQAKSELAKSLLSEFGLETKLDRLPKHLSGGEQQRVAIARALIMKPAYVFADEPTGNLDSANGDIVMKLLQRASTEFKSTVIYVTHDPDYARLAQMKIEMSDGRQILPAAATV
jgi:putative ABC transport system ATP-binding protein/lipoprotein-releasing system ATP-binding protein